MIKATIINSISIVVLSILLCVRGDNLLDRLVIASDRITQNEVALQEKLEEYDLYNLHTKVRDLTINTKEDEIYKCIGILSEAGFSIYSTDFSRIEDSNYVFMVNGSSDELHVDLERKTIQIK